MRELNSTIFPNQERPHAKIKLFCFPYSGAGRNAFHPWINDISDDIAPFTIQYPGHGGRGKEPLELDIYNLASSISETLKKSCETPFAIFAHSLGASIAYEVLLILQKKYNLKPLCFFASGRPPHVNTEKEKNRIRSISDTELLKVIKSYNLTPDWILKNETIMSYYLPTLRNDFIMYQEYCNPKFEVLDFPIHGIIADQDKRLSIENAQKWISVTQKEFHLKIVKGNHFYFKDASQAAVLINYIEKELENIVLNDLSL